MSAVGSAVGVVAVSGRHAVTPSGRPDLRVGVIGAGYWGPNLVRNFSEAPRAGVVAVADLYPERLGALHKRFPAVGTTTGLRVVVRVLETANRSLKASGAPVSLTELVTA